MPRDNELHHGVKASEEYGIGPNALVKNVVHSSLSFPHKLVQV